MLVAFVRKENGSWKGCHEHDTCKKKIVLADVGVAETLLENVLYNTVLVPMKERMGFVAISAEPVTFKANIGLAVNDGCYAVEVKFGHKKIVYDPASKMENRRSLEGVIQTLSRSVDIKDPDRVVEDFKEAAETVLAYYKAQRHGR